jgi:DHA3 family tetracycline resistance protein-like MFS transporter
MHLFAKKPSAYGVYLILSSVSTFANAVMFTVLSVYYVTVVGMNPLQLVLVGTAMEIATFVFEVPTGIIADTYSRRLSVIIGMVVTGAAFALVGTVPTFMAVLCGLVIWGIGSTFISGAREAWITDEVGEEHVGQVFLRTTQVRQIAALVGTFVSVALASVQLNLPIVIGAGLTIALGALLAVIMPEQGFQPTLPAERTSWQIMGSTLRDGLRAVRHSAMLLIMLGIIMFSGAFSEGFDRLWEAHFLANFHFPALGALEPIVWFGIINAGGQLISLLAVEVTRRRVDTTQSSSMIRALLIVNLLLVAGVIVFGAARSFASALVAFWSILLLRSVSSPLFDTWLNQNVDSRVRATVLSISSQADAFGQFVGGPALGAIGTVRSLRAAMIAAGLILSPAVGLYARALRQAPSSPQTEPSATASEV